MYQLIEDIVNDVNKTGTPFWKLIETEDCNEQEIDEETSFARMKAIYEAMKESDRAYDSSLKSASGLVGGEGAKINKRIIEGRMISGDFIGRVMEKALKVSESNACMKRIVAAPTAGSCGVLPAVLLSLQEKENFADEDMIKALYVSAGIGGVIASHASLAGASHGCQAEIGAASAMAAGAIVHLYGGSAEEIGHAAALALKAVLGLACDPVAGLVEVPCVKRNVMGAVNAITSADMVLAGIYSKIPADEVFDAMNNIGKHMDEEIRETAEGGLAVTPTGNEVRRKISF